MKSLIATFAILALAGFANCINNPVILNRNSPDPGVIFHEGYYYAATTAIQSETSKFAIHKSKDLQNWDLVGYVFPEGQLPTWTTQASDFWAPEIHIINGQFRVVFAARETSTGLLCVGVGSANNITGPFTDSGAPLVKNLTVGSIDPTIYKHEDGTYYLLWKDDGNGCVPQIPASIKAQVLNSDGLSVSGEISYLIRNTLPWEADVVEGPWVIKRKGYYYLFYSGHDYCNGTYAVGVARSKSLLGPYEKKGDPILKSNSDWSGPGHCSVLKVHGEWDTYAMIYHSWQGEQMCANYDRLLMVDYIHWSDDWPYMKTASPMSYDPLRQSFRRKIEYDAVEAVKKVAEVVETAIEVAEVIEEEIKKLGF